MAKTLYPKGAEKILRPIFEVDTLKVALLASSYTYSAAHEFFSDISANVVGTPQTLASKVVTGGVFDAADADFGTVAAGSTIGSFVIYKDTGSPSTSPLLIYSTEATGFPLATSGGTLSIPWSNGVAKIMSLV